MREVSREEARRIAVRAQGLDGPLERAALRLARTLGLEAVERD